MADRLFDTTVFVDYFRGWEEAQRFIEPILQGNASASFSVITEAELWAGIRGQQEMPRYEALLSLMERAIVDGSVARRGGELTGQYRSQGLTLPDALIAATAMLRGETLLTRNIRHFRLLEPELECEVYRI